MDSGAAASNTDVLPNRGENDSVLKGGAAEGILSSMAEAEIDEPISPFVNVQDEVFEQVTGMPRKILGT